MHSPAVIHIVIHHPSHLMVVIGNPAPRLQNYIGRIKVTKEIMPVPKVTRHGISIRKTVDPDDL